MENRDRRADWDDLELPEELEPLRSHIESSLRPCVALRPGKPGDERSVRGSRLGGEPAMDLSTSWPMGREAPMTFMGQLDFEELSRIAVPELGLPTTGILTMFYDLTRAPQVGHAAEISAIFRLHFAEGEVAPLVPPTGVQRLPRQELPAAALHMSMPHVWDLAPRSWPGFTQELDANAVGAAAARSAYRGIYDGGRNQVRGHANWVQDDPRIHGVKIDADRWDHLPDPPGWSLLWQLAYQPSWGLKWWSEIDASRIFILIRDEHLAARDFSRTYLAWQCV